MRLKCLSVNIVSVMWIISSEIVGKVNQTENNAEEEEEGEHSHQLTKIIVIYLLFNHLNLLQESHWRIWNLKLKFLFKIYSMAKIKI